MPDADVLRIVALDLHSALAEELSGADRGLVRVAALRAGRGAAPARGARDRPAPRERGGRSRPVTIEGRAIARSFWGKAWCDNLERYSDLANRLPRGRTYVRNGSVMDLQLGAGTVTALVSGSELYRVSVTIAPLPRAAGGPLVKECAGQIGSLVELLQGKFSRAVMETLIRPSAGLFPSAAGDRLRVLLPGLGGDCASTSRPPCTASARVSTPSPSCSSGCGGSTSWTSCRPPAAARACRAGRRDAQAHRGHGAGRGVRDRAGRGRGHQRAPAGRAGRRRPRGPGRRDDATAGPARGPARGERRLIDFRATPRSAHGWPPLQAEAMGNEITATPRPRVDEADRAGPRISLDSTRRNALEFGLWRTRSSRAAPW